MNYFSGKKPINKTQVESVQLGKTKSSFIPYPSILSPSLSNKILSLAEDYMQNLSLLLSLGLFKEFLVVWWWGGVVGWWGGVVEAHFSVQLKA